MLYLPRALQGDPGLRPSHPFHHICFFTLAPIVSLLFLYRLMTMLAGCLALTSSTHNVLTVSRQNRPTLALRD